MIKATEVSRSVTSASGQIDKMPCYSRINYCVSRMIGCRVALNRGNDTRLPYLDTLDRVSRWCSTQRRSRVPGLSQRNGRCALPQKIYGAVAYTPTNTVRARGGHGRHGVASG